MADDTMQAVAHEWVSFPGGELEGQRPKALCPACREALKAAARGAAQDAVQGEVRPVNRRAGGTLCFQCYRANLDRERALRQAGTVDTASEARFQAQLPFEPVNEGRLAILKLDCAQTRARLVQGVERFAHRRRQAQMAARRALQSIVAARPSRESTSAAYDRAIAAAFHAAELQLPESWLPFVVAR